MAAFFDATNAIHSARAKADGSTQRGSAPGPQAITPPFRESPSRGFATKHSDGPRVPDKDEVASSILASPTKIVAGQSRYRGMRRPARVAFVRILRAFFARELEHDRVARAGGTRATEVVERVRDAFLRLRQHVSVTVEHNRA